MSGPTSEPGPALRIATYNLLSGRDVRGGGRFDLEAAAEAIKALEADVVALQEVDRGLIRSGECDQVAELATRLGRTGIFAPALLGDPTLRWARGPGADPRPRWPGVRDRPAQRTAPDRGRDRGAARRRPRRGAPRRPDSRRPPIPYRDGEPRAALRVTVEAPWGPVAVTTAHLTFVPWRAQRQLATVAASLRRPGQVVRGAC